jgi:Na+-driven multidrug efflux pump
MFGWFIGMQNSRISMTVAITTNVVNVLCSLLFVAILKIDIRGVALGYSAGQQHVDFIFANFFPGILYTSNVHW